jgi:hypothetical protein
VTSVAFRPDGREIVIVTDEGSARTLIPLPVRMRREGDAVRIIDGPFAPFLFVGGRETGDAVIECEVRRDAGEGPVRLEFRRGTGSEPVRIAFGNWGNAHVVYGAGTQKTVPGTFETGHWHRVRLAMSGREFACELDGREFVRFNAPSAALAGEVILAVEGCSASFRRIRVTAPDGKVLRDGFGELAADWFEPLLHQVGHTFLKDPVAAFADTPGRFFWVLDRGGTVRVYRSGDDVGFDGGMPLPPAEVGAGVACAAVARAGRRVAVGLEGGRVRALDVLPPAKAAPTGGGWWLEVVGANPLPLSRLLSGTTSVETDDGVGGRACLRFAGVAANPRVPGWEYPFARDPGEGQFRYLRFAWKGAGARFLRVRLALDGRWEHALQRSADPAPGGWSVVTVDLGPVLPKASPRLLTGISLEAVGGEGLFGPLVISRVDNDLGRILGTSP